MKTLKDFFSVVDLKTFIVFSINAAHKRREEALGFFTDDIRLRVIDDLRPIMSDQ